MPDISMCEGTGCLIKETCYRYTAEPSIRQSYFRSPSYISSIEDCEYYWNNGKETNEK
jgi:hypothetical protein